VFEEIRDESAEELTATICCSIRTYTGRRSGDLRKILAVAEVVAIECTADSKIVGAAAIPATVVSPSREILACYRDYGLHLDNHIVH
jgi:hypothetical protein